MEFEQEQIEFTFKVLGNVIYCSVSHSVENQSLNCSTPTNVSTFLLSPAPLLEGPCGGNILSL
jgi:hypothetical protein